jgi:hypothetical protein
VEPLATTGPTPAGGSPTDRPADAPTSEDETPERAGQARVQVHALPFGDVWIDGRRVGSTPFERAIAPGRHRIDVGRGRQEQGRTVTLRPGERRSLRFDLVSGSE